MNLLLSWICDESILKRYRQRCLKSGRRLLRIFKEERHKFLNANGQGAIESILQRLKKAGLFEMSVRAFKLFANEYEGWDRAQLPAQQAGESRICARYITIIKRNLSPDERTLLELDIRENGCKERLEKLDEVIQMQQAKLRKRL